MFQWSQNNYFKSNSEKCHLPTTSKLINREKRTKHVGVNIKDILNFCYHTQMLSKLHATCIIKKLHASLLRLSKYSPFELVVNLLFCFF